MRAKFIGKDGCGFKYGQTYDLETSIRQVYGLCICLKDKNSMNWCPYSSLEALLENWIIVDKQ